MDAERLSRQVIRRTLIVVGTLACLMAFFGWIVGDQWSMQGYESSTVSRSAILGLPHDGLVIEQGFDTGCESIDQIELQAAPTADTVSGSLTAELLRDHRSMVKMDIDLTQAMRGDALLLDFSGQGVLTDYARNAVLRLTYHDPEGLSQLPAIFCGDSVEAGRFSLDASGLDQLTVEGESRRARLCMTVRGHNRSNIMRWYWPCALVVTLLALLVGLHTAYCARHGKQNLILRLMEIWKRYHFLLLQLVQRDFNTKYRQSLLGVLWSFLNPLLTMSVQYVVFSTIFKSSIPNFPVYLITGIILFNFFSEAVSLGLDSIVMNGPLITKVAMPKYIYPLSRTVSSIINLLISFVPLILLMFLTHVPLKRSLLLAPLDIVFVFCFALGIAMLLCTLNVFFRDTRFLWSVLVLLWTYATPIFYPESIIPATLIKLFHFNPMYQYIYFLRCITLDGVTPAPINYLYCILSSALSLGIGAWVFHRNQDRFVFYL